MGSTIIFHAKIIWWEEFGAYIGSANLTSRAWYTNIEAGIFLTHDELISNGMLLELNDFFDELNSVSTPLTKEIYDELYEINKNRTELKKQERNLEKEFEEDRLIPKLKSKIIEKTKGEKDNKRKNNFLTEWYETLQILRDIAETVSRDENRPNWIKSNVPNGVQADQFLHAYYYSKVKDGNKSLHYKFHAKNKNNPHKALLEALKWWQSLASAPNNEDVMINEWAVDLKLIFSKDNIKNISEKDFIEICGKVHALRNYALRVKYSILGFKKPYPTLEHDDRIELLGKHLYAQRSIENKTLIESLDYFLYGGSEQQTPERLWELVNFEKWNIPNLGVSSLGEIVGWAKPELFPPRNGRTSKALTSLGYSVKIHSQ